MNNDDVNGICRIWDDATGDVSYDEQGEPLKDLDGKYIEYDDEGKLINTHVSKEMLEFINKYSL